MKQKIKAIVVVMSAVILLGIGSCKKEKTTTNPPPAVVADDLKSEIANLLDTISPIYYKSNQLMISNTESVVDFLKKQDSIFYFTHFKTNALQPEYQMAILTGRMALIANSILDTTTTHNDGGSPNHNGVVYSYGSKQYQTRVAPSSGKCKEAVFGLDCSGFLYQLLSQAGVAYAGPNKDVKEEYSSTYIQEALNNSDFNKLKIIPLGNIATNEIERGDIIYWDNGPNERHIGFNWKFTDNVLYNSHGSSGDSAKNCNSVCQCDKNLDHKKRGARSIPLSTAINGTGFWGSGYKVLRFSEFEVSPASFNSPKAGFSQNIKVSTRVNWKASVNQSWVTLSKATGKGVDNIQITTSANNSGTTRTAQIKISIDVPGFSGFQDQIISVTQQSSSSCSIDTVVDIDGNIYNVVSIGSQCWMQENLKTTRYRNGDALQTGLSVNSWASTTSGAYVIYDDDMANNAIYGKLYNWYSVVDSRNLCPTGFHIPSETDWDVLKNSLGGDSTVVGNSMKEIGLWATPTTGNNNSGFSGLPGGGREGPSNVTPLYYLKSYYGFWWSSYDVNSGTMGFSLHWSDGVLYNSISSEKHTGMSVRCLMD